MSWSMSIECAVCEFEKGSSGHMSIDCAGQTSPIYCLIRLPIGKGIVHPKGICANPIPFLALVRKRLLHDEFCIRRRTCVSWVDQWVFRVLPNLYNLLLDSLVHSKRIVNPKWIYAHLISCLAIIQTLFPHEEFCVRRRTCVSWVDLWMFNVLTKPRNLLLDSFVSSKQNCEP